MGYNTAIEQSIVISKYHHKLAKALGELPENKRGKRQQIEFLIEEAAAKAGILELQS